MPKKVDKRYFTLFKLECKHWIDIYGLNDYLVHYIHQDNASYDTLAYCCSDDDNHNCILGLCKTWMDEVEPLNENTIRHQACHEVYELLLSKLDDLIRKRFDITKNDLEEARHSTIQRLVNAHFKKSLKERGLIP